MSKLDPEFPTFSNNRSATSPDFITGNRYANLNIYSKPGRISSNHLPVIAIISINPIRIPFQPRFHCRKVDWKTFKNRFQNSNILDVNGTLPTKVTPGTKTLPLLKWQSINKYKKKHWGDTAKSE